MKNLSFLLLLFVCSVAMGQGQIVIQRPNGGPTSFALRLDSAIAKAQPGDDIYLPGGGVVGVPALITKRVNLFGTGHHLDSSKSTGVTNISSSITFSSGSDGSMISGLVITNVNIQASNIRVFRVRATGNIEISSSSIPASGISNIFVSEVICGSIGIQSNSFNVYIEKTINYGDLRFISAANCFGKIRNSIFLKNGSNDNFNINPKNATNFWFENNVFLYSAFNYVNTSSNYFYNNIFVESSSVISSVINKSGNFFSIPVGSIFIDYPVGQVFSTQHNYNLSSVGLNAGTDGTDIGIFGSDAPFKLSGRSINPQFMQIQIPSQTNAAGQLPIQIRVKAQDN